MDLLDDLGSQLRALSAEQPVQPGNRVPSVTRRARRIRTTRIAVAAAAALALAVPAGVVLSSVHHDTATQYADVTTWPDRTPQQYAGLGDGVLEALAQADDAASNVHWLYRAKIDLPDHNPTAVAVLTADIKGRHVLVSAVSVGIEVDAHGRRLEDGTRKAVWDTNDQVELKNGDPLGHVGFYLSYDVGTEPRSFAVVLGPPTARTLRWTMRPLPYAPASADPDRGAIPSTDGVFIGPLGALVGPLDISLDGRAAGTLASGTSLPTLVRPAVPAPPSWNSSLGGGSFETSRNGALSWGAPGYGSLTGQDGVLLACYGGGTLTAIVTLDAAARDTVLSRKAVACNGSVQVVREAQARSDKRSATLSFERSDRFQAVRFASGHPG